MKKYLITNVTLKSLNIHDPITEEYINIEYTEKNEIISECSTLNIDYGLDEQFENDKIIECNLLSETMVNSKYTDNDRKRILDQYEQGKRLTEISNIFNMPMSTVKNILNVFQKEGRIEKKARGGKTHYKITPAIVDYIQCLVDNQCWISLKNVQLKVKQRHGILLSITT
ncbi:hypothetical protein A3Q56_07590, partial [Intoshia linei]